MRWPDARDRPGAQTSILAAFAFLAVFFSGVFPPFSNPNELSRFQTVVSAVEDGTFAIDGVIQRLGGHEDKAVSGGRTYSNKAPGLALAGIPVYGLLRFVLPPPGAPDPGPIFWALRVLTVSLVCLFALVRFGRRLSRQGAAGAAPLLLCAVAFGTPYVFYARSFFGHAWTAALLFLAWDFLRSAEERGSSQRVTAWLFGAGLLAGWAAISEYTAAPVALLLLLRAAAGRAWRSLILFGLGAAVPLVLLGVYNTICFGAPWILSSAREAYPSYSRLAATGVFGFGPPSPVVAAAYLVHPARGVVWFSPFLLWAIPGFVRWWRSREDRADCLLALAATLLFCGIMTGYPNWHGGWALGNRYLLPILFFPAVAIGYALSTPLARGLFAVAVVYSVASHLLLTTSWPYFPTNVPWPVATGSEWFLARGWVAPNMLGTGGVGPLLAFTLAVAAIGVSLALSLRAAVPISPRPALTLLLGLAPLALLLLKPPPLDFGGRLWRAAIYGACSGGDPERRELEAVARSATTASEQLRAREAKRMYGPTR